MKRDEGLLFEELTRSILGCAMEVLNLLGHGFNEKPYENALVVEFGLRQMAYDQQSKYDVLYKGVRVGEYIPDLIVGRAVVVDATVVDQITDHEIGQMINYLRITGLKVGLIINFKHAKLEWKRVAL